jgi:hypothetical protein
MLAIFRPWRRTVAVLVTSAAAGAGALGSSSAFADTTCATTGTQTFVFTGAEQCYAVPDGYTGLIVTAIGGRGYSTPGKSGVSGSFGAKVKTVVAAVPGDVLYVHVGGPGASAAGGWNAGGAPGGTGSGGGGGASDVSAQPGTMASPLVVAGGAGGPGGGATSGAGEGGAGGTGGIVGDSGETGAGYPCASIANGAGGGGGGTRAGATSEGGGGAAESPKPNSCPMWESTNPNVTVTQSTAIGNPGIAGSGSTGGPGAAGGSTGHDTGGGGGGGGGGYRGGGGGASGGAITATSSGQQIGSTGQGAGGGGGGAGSSYVAPSADVPATTVGPAAAAASVSITPVKAPGAPTDVDGFGGNASATLAFTAPVADGGTAVTRYTIHAYDQTAQTAGPTKTGVAGPMTVTGLTNNHAYTFTVTAGNGAGDSPESAATGPITPHTPNVTVHLGHVLKPASEDERVDLLVNGSAVRSAAADGESGSLTVPWNSTVTVSESSAAGPGLGAYASSVDCGPDGTGDGTSLTIKPTSDAACTITNTRRPDTAAATTTAAPVTPSGPAATPTPPPVAKLTLSASKKVRFARLTVAIPVTCTVKPGTLKSCAVSLRRGKRALASGTTRTKTGGLSRLVVKLKLTKAGRKAFAHRRTLALSLAATGTTTDGRRATASRRLTLQRT